MKLEPANIVCPACGNANYMRHLIGKNVGHLDMKCINCNSYFNFDELYKQRIGEALKPKPITNADRIRSMTDEELASGIWTDFGPNKWCKNYSGCTDDELCAGCILKWLREEVNE